MGKCKIDDITLAYQSYSEVWKALTGDINATTFDGNLKVLGQYSHYKGNDAVKRRLLGSLTGNTGPPGKFKNKGDCIRYIDSSGYEREACPSAVLFYPSLDGRAQRTTVDPWETWSELRNGVGTGHNDTIATILISMKAGGDENKWANIYRGILLFDTSSIPETATISSAMLRLTHVISMFDWTDGYVVVSSDPASTEELADADYQCLGDMAFSNVINPETNPDHPYFNFVFNPSGIAAIAKGEGAITKLGVRVNSDRTNEEPTCGESQDYYCQFGAKEQLTIDRRPRLTVSY